MGEPTLPQSQSRSQNLDLNRSLSMLALKATVAVALLAGLVTTLLVVWGSQ